MTSTMMDGPLAVCGLLEHGRTWNGERTVATMVAGGIRSGGRWISSVEPEAIVLTHPSITEVSVIGVPDDRWDERPCASVVPVVGGAVTGCERRDRLVGRVAAETIEVEYLTTKLGPE